MKLPVLDPCPFCGNAMQPDHPSLESLDFEDVGYGNAISDDPEYPNYCWKVVCYRCGASGPSHGVRRDNYFSRAKAARKWNKRKCG